MFIVELSLNEILDLDLTDIIYNELIIHKRMVFLIPFRCWFPQWHMYISYLLTH